MIIELWSTFVFLSIILFVIGFYTLNDLLRYFAVILFFFMGQIIEFSGVQYVTGFTGNYTINGSVTAITYGTFVSHTIGFYMMVVAIMTMVFIFFERRHLQK